MQLTDESQKGNKTKQRKEEIIAFFKYHKLLIISN